MDDAFVLGHGFVGKATMLGLDIPWYFSRSESNITLKEGAKKKWCFICLPTQTDSNGEQTAARKVIHDYIAQLADMKARCIFVIRSTVLPGTARALHEEFNVPVVSCPEFLSEDTWEKDATKPRIIIMGADDNGLGMALEDLWKKTKCKVKLLTDTVTAETFKYAFNTFMITKIVWANALYDICQKNGADYEIIHQGLHQHPWGSKHHFKVIHKGGRGAGGHCFPKDIKAFAQYANSRFLKSVEEINNEYLSKTGKQ